MTESQNEFALVTHEFSLQKSLSDIGMQGFKKSNFRDFRIIRKRKPWAEEGNGLIDLAMMWGLDRLRCRIGVYVDGVLRVGWEREAKAGKGGPRG
jgi:hypothetical protein